MPLSEVSNAVYQYLKPENSNIPNLGAVYMALPKVSDESQLFINTFPGLGIGAVIYAHFSSQYEKRIALGGPPVQPVPYSGGGRKWREYDLALLIVFKSDLPQTIDGQIAYNSLIDALTARIESDRAAGTDAPQYGGDGSAAVFQWGEGGVNGGDDIRFEHLVPRTIDGGVTLFQGVGHITVAEELFV